jgi:hypothetical protein
VQLGDGWVIFRAGITPMTETERVPTAISEVMAAWLKERPDLHVRATLPIVEEGNTIAVHVWFDS